MKKRPIIYLAFANDRDRYLTMLNQERKSILGSLKELGDSNAINLKVEPSATVEDVFQTFGDYDDQIVIFHFGGHAGKDYLLLESESGGFSSANATGIAQLLGKQKALKLVFLNGCATKSQVGALLDAGVPSVIATSVGVDDSMAMEFAQQFYNALSKLKSIESAFSVASAFVNAKYKLKQKVHSLRGSRLAIWLGDETALNPWGLYSKSNTDLQWTIPQISRRSKILTGFLQASIVSLLVLVAGFGIARLFGYDILADLRATDANQSQSLTVQVIGPDNIDETMLWGNGMLRILYGDTDKSETIDKDGEVVYTGIPISVFSNSIPVQFDLINVYGEEFYLSVPDSQYSLIPGQRVILNVRLKGIDRLYGTVIDDKDLPLGDVTIRVLNMRTLTDSLGYFHLRIPDTLQRQFHTIYASKEGYKPVSHMIPMQTDKELHLTLDPVQ